MNGLIHGETVLIHQDFQVPKMEVLNPSKAILGGGFSLT